MLSLVEAREETQRYTEMMCTALKQDLSVEVQDLQVEV